MYREERDQNNQKNVNIFDNTFPIPRFSKIEKKRCEKDYKKREWQKPSFSITKLGPCVLDEDNE